jgi:hydrogenase maturation factor
MCLGTIGQVTEVGADLCVKVLAGDREITGSLLAVSESVQRGDWVLVHSGLVLARLTEAEARDALGLREPALHDPPATLLA